MSKKYLGAAIGALSLLMSCSDLDGGSGGSNSLVPAAVVRALQNCAELRGINFWSLVDAIKNEIQDDATLPIQVDLDGDGTDELTIDGSIVLTSATEGTVDWSLSGALTGSGSATFEVIGASLSISGNGTITGLDGCAFDFTIAVTAPMAVSAQGVDGRVEFTVTTTDGTTLSGTLVFTMGAASVQVMDLLLTYTDEEANQIEVALDDFSFELPDLGGEPPMAAGGIVFAAEGSFEEGDGDYELWSIEADGSGLTRLTTNDFDEHTPVVSPDGSRIAFVRGDDGGAELPFGELYVMNADGTGVRALTAFGDDTLVDTPAWSPDGSTIVFSILFGPEPGIHVIDADDPGATSEPLVAAGGQPVQSPSYSSDGSTVAYAEFLGGIIFIDATTGEVDGSLFPPPFNARDPFFSPVAGDDRLLYGENQALYVFDPTVGDTPELLVQVVGGGTAPFSPTWSPDSSQVVYILVHSNGFESLRVVDLASQEDRHLFGPHRALDRASWGPTTTLVVAGGHLWTMDTQGGSLRRIAREPGQTSDAVLAPDGAHVALVARPDGSVSDELFLITGSDGSDVRQLTFLGLGARVTALAWSRDGQRLTFTVDYGSGPEQWAVSVDGPGSEVRLAPR